MTQGGEYPAGYSFQMGENRLTLKWTSASAGAVPSSLTCKRGFGTPIRDSGGTYHVAFSNHWSRYLGAVGDVLQTGGGYDETKAKDVKVIAYDASTKTLSFVTTRPDTGAAIDMETGDVLTLRVWMAQETIPGRR